MTREVALGGRVHVGLVALVDDADYDLVMQYPWWSRSAAAKSGRTYGPYAVTWIYPSGIRRQIGMHKLITGWPLTDHINHDGLDNRRCNLRQATHSQNTANARRRQSNACPFKGIRRKSTGRYEARIKQDGIAYQLGSFDNATDAALAYDLAAQAIFGEYACTNFPVPLAPDLKDAQERILAIGGRNPLRTTCGLPEWPAEPQTHCSAGHELTPENSFERAYRSGTRICCRQCQREHEAAYKARKKADRSSEGPRVGEADDMQRGSGVLAGAGIKGEI